MTPGGALWGKRDTGEPGRSLTSRCLSPGAVQRHESNYVVKCFASRPNSHLFGYYSMPDNTALQRQWGNSLRPHNKSVR